MDTLIVGINTLLFFAGLSLIFILLNLINLQKLKVKYLLLKEKLYYFGILYYADIIIIAGSGLVGYLIYKLSQGN
jgi:hypothetical protein